MFIGREAELQRLKEFQGRKTAGIIVVSGRRRIGKSTLIEYFGKKSRFLEFYGLAPSEGITTQDQLDHFGELVGLAFNVPSFKFNDWNSAFSTLAGFTSKGKVIIFLDEISWMANKEKDFPGKLKGAWDTKFKLNPQLTLILCGSVTSWIQENILNNKGFMGRVSLTINLEEMPLSDANKFWKKMAVSAYEKFKVLGVTGGIPRYLEEIQPEQTAEQNIKRLGFSKGGLLVDEFDKIFSDIFGAQADEYKQIVRHLTHGSLSTSDLCQKLCIEPTGGFSKKIDTLKQSGFLSRDYVWNGNRKQPKLSRYRLKDNYLRFYLRYIEPKKHLIEENVYDNLHLEDLPEWHAIMGLQFENLVLNNIHPIQQLLQIPPSSILSAAPYFQPASKRREGCQIDLLIQCRYCFYVCEIKFAANISTEVISDVTQKIGRLNFSKETSIRPVLIYQGKLSSAVVNANFFTHLISFDQLLIRVKTKGCFC